MENSNPLFEGYRKQALKKCLCVTRDGFFVMNWSSWVTPEGTRYQLKMVSQRTLEEYMFKKYISHVRASMSDLDKLQEKYAISA